MFSLPTFFAPAAVNARLLNKLLQREDWARDRLARHAGKSVGFKVGGFRMALSIQADGLVQASDQAVVPNVTLTIQADQLAGLPGVLRARDPALLTELLHVEGDAGLAQVVSELARDLRWDVEDDLSRVVGDVAATRLLQTAGMLRAGAEAAASRLAGNASEFMTEEAMLLASRPAYDEWAVRLQAIHGRLDELDRRVAALAPSSVREG
ncbi:SCP2 sterol-binding domain-containing protein [Pusillimonas sp. MFBS29]|uniref:ubiquinone biosynthesis accessory factor UbiJ n=1 Tax=Pusillimonas sp. MFBS29 TaxID=2886690 RepID=UPI001D105FBE|nr:SCP2 sterol-binding domain-containing protein [Pusillimonas sp. MFBS29]MCC2597592.1 SCP2 sterol-binding domain-containing protein [Pusillimonas sp. MFBS29]